MKFWFGKKEEETATVPEKADAATVFTPAAGSATTASSSAAAPVAAAPSTTAPKAAPAAQASAPAVPVRPQKNQKALYYQMMNALYDAVLILDENGHVVDCNERASSIFGHSREELWDAAVTTLIPGINAQIFAKMKDGLHGNRRVLINARCHRKDGTTFPGEVGAGLMDLTCENLVLTVRNIEKRAPIRAIIRPTS
jgi:PAS domain S-box-containing protein